MEEAVLCRSAAKLRELFAILVSTCGVSNPIQLWEKYKDALSEDIAHTLQGTHAELITNEALKLIEDKINNLCGKNMVDFGLPTPQRRGELSSDVIRELNYDTVALDTFVNEMTPHLLPEQEHVYNLIIQRVNSGEPGIFFLDAPGGTGKTFVLNLLLARLRKDRNIALAVASSGIAATLLTGGRTAHSTFKLPLNLASEETPTCNISKTSNRGALLQQCKLIVWDECTMSHKRAVEALNRSLQDIRSNQALMGGVVVLLAGDFRQTLPVIVRGTPADEMNACLKASALWSKVEKLYLTCNMRVQLFNDLECGEYASKLLQIGEGVLQTNIDGKIEFNSDFCNPVMTEDELILCVYPNLQINIRNHDWLCERAVLSPKNESVHNINKKIMEGLVEESKIYTSIDTVMSSDDSTSYPVEFLNTLELTGVPSHKLELKIGVPVLLMRNLDAPRLCNGTRLCVTETGRNVIKATILTGAAKGDSVLIPRIPIIPNNLPFEFKRLQFPLKLAFTMTINKSQGQTLKVAGLHLGTPCFAHGQLYVGCSRVSSAQNLYVLAENNKSYNVVYRDILK
ncbi:ATP-dependent DNA helicase pif1-like [Rhagoletis pomonella]|uniref:ATP-dependent DNA helicase pif1-like n=1 Tax=Rhagoletis pomonella TaxID=28610 RepID=UPI001781B291|nr:ATP-dependent DNA helicase pif1-like [Rhagoletis pomonella]